MAWIKNSLLFEYFYVALVRMWALLRMGGSKIEWLLHAEALIITYHFKASV